MDVRLWIFFFFFFFFFCLLGCFIKHIFYSRCEFSTHMKLSITKLTWALSSSILSKTRASVSRIQQTKYLPNFWHQDVNKSTFWSALPCFRLYTIDKIPKLSKPDGNLLSSDPFRMCLNDGYINFRTHCLRLTASNKINQKKQKIWSEVWPTPLRCFWKNGNRSVTLSRKILTRFSLTNVMLYCNCHFETDSNCTAALFHINWQ